MYAWVLACTTSEPGACRSQKRVLNFLEPELQVVVTHSMWVHRTEPTFSARSASALNHRVCVCVHFFYLLRCVFCFFIYSRSEKKSIKLLANGYTFESKRSLFLGVFIPNKTFFLLRILVLKNLSWQYNLELHDFASHSLYCCWCLC